MKEKPLFVGVEDSKGIRMSLLESSRDIVKTLQAFENLRATRIEKVEKIMLLKNTIKEIEDIKNMLNEKIPDYGLSIKKEKSSPKTKEKTDEIKKLEQELSYIEEKLSRFS